METMSRSLVLISLTLARGIERELQVKSIIFPSDVVTIFCKGFFHAWKRRLMARSYSAIIKVYKTQWIVVPGDAIPKHRVAFSFPGNFDFKTGLSLVTVCRTIMFLDRLPNYVTHHFRGIL